MAGVTVEWCPECGLWVEPFVQDNVGYCPYCRGTTKDEANEVQTGPDFMDIPETTPRGKLIRFSRCPKDEFSVATLAGKPQAKSKPSVRMPASRRAV